MPELVDLFDHPPLHEPLLVVGLPGWIDAGVAAAAAIQTILDTHDSELVATFDTDALLDYRARRPIMSLVEGVVEELTWPAIEMRAIVDAHGNHIVVLSGAEPDHAWGSFCSTIVDTALDLGVRMIIGLGAYPAPVPHTRDTRLSATSPSSDIIDGLTGFERGTIEVPAGVQTAIEVAAVEQGIPALGLWAQVPHYISGMPYPAAALGLIEALNRTAGVALVTGTLADDSAATRRQVDELVEANEQHRRMIAQLEEVYDATPAGAAFGPLPTGDELAAELQAWLRDQDD
jgi:predicted ATP-grasp superfamily ATP-dependent carboligase